MGRGRTGVTRLEAPVNPPHLLLLMDFFLQSNLENLVEQCPLPVDAQAARKLVMGYARFLTGKRPKSPEGKGLTILENQWLRYWTYYTVKGWALLDISRIQPQWEAIIDGSKPRPMLTDLVP